MLKAASISSNTPSDPPAYTSNPPTATRTRVNSYLLLSKPSDADIQDDNNLSIWSRTCEFFFSIFSSTTVLQYFRATSATRRSGSLTAYKGVPTRRSRRLQGLPAELIEELKKARQRRRLERQISSGSTESVLLQAAEEPDQDDEELLEEILLQREELNDKDREKDQHHEKTNVFTTLNIFLFSLFNSLKQLFTKVGFGKKDVQKTFPLRRSRRLQGLPAEVIEELKKARQRRRLERQISSGSTEPILLQAAEEPDQDDEELLEEILLQREELPLQKEQENHEETSVFGILSTFYFKSSNFLKQMFTKVGFEKNFNRQDLPLRRSRRLQGLPAEVIEELKKARQRRRLERQISSGSSEPILLQAPDEPDQDDEELLEEILLQREELSPQKEQEHHEETSVITILSTFYFKFSNFLKQMFTKVGFEKKYNRQDFPMRRSRRLQGLPAEVIEELKKARQRRRLERQISSGSTSTESVLLQAPDEPDQDDEELLEEILQREENKNQYEENISILTIVRNFCVSSLNIFTEIFTKFGFGKEHVAKRSPLKRSRRLQGLPAEVIEELKKARQRRRLERQFNSGSTEPVLLQAPDEPDQDDEELLEKILLRKESNDVLQENVNTPGQWNEFRAPAELKGCNHNDNEMFELSEDETDQIFPNQTSKYENSWKQFLRFLCLPVSWIHGKLSSSIPMSNTVGLRKSRRLQGLPPHILEEFNRITSRRIYGELSINQDLTPEDENILNDILLRDEFIKDPRDNSTTGENKAMISNGAYEYNVSGVVPAVWNQASRLDFLSFLLSFLPKFLNLNSVTQDELKGTTEPVLSTNICASRRPEIAINTSHQNEIIRKARLQEKHKSSKSRILCWILIPFFLGTCFLLVDHFQLFNTSLEKLGNLTISFRENCYKYLSRSNLFIVSSLSGIQNSFSEYLSSIGEIIYDVSNSILNFFASKLEDSLSFIQSLFSWMVQLPSTGINWSWRIVSNVSSSGISSSRKIIQTVQQIIEEILSRDTINFGTWTWNLGSSIGTWTWNLGSTIGTCTWNLGSSIGTWTWNLGSSIGIWTWNLGSSIGTWTWNLGSTIGTWTWNLGSSIGTWTWNLGSSIGTLTQNLGSYIGTSTWNLVASFGTWTQNLGSHIETSTWNIGTSFGTWTWILGSSIGTGIQNFVSHIGICISDLASYIQNSTWNLGTSFGTLTSNLSSGIGTGIQNFAYSIRIWVQNLGSDIVTFTWNLCASFGTWTVNLGADIGSSTWKLCASFGTWIWNLCSDLGTSAWNQGSSLGTAILTLPAHFGTGIYSSGADVSTGLFNLGAYIWTCSFNIGSYIFNGFWNFGTNILDWILNLGLGLGTSMTSLGEGFISLTYSQGFAFGSGLVGLLIEAWTRSNKFIFSPTNNIVSTPDYETIVEHILENKRFIKSLEDLSAKSNLDLETVLRESLNLEISSNLDSRLDRVKEEIQGLLLDIQQKNEFNINSEKTDLSHFEAKIEEISANIENMAAKYKDVADENESKVLGLKTGIDDLNTRLDEIEGGLSRLRIDLQSCCRSRVELEATISRMISEAFSSNLTPELTKNYVLKPELENIESTLMESVGSIRQEMLELIKTSIGKEKFESRLEELVRREGLNKTTGLGEREVALIVENALIQYDADKTGLFDFALETAGGSVISTRCTETYVQKSAMYSVFGIPIWYPSNNPRTIIQPGVQPGECWAFKGSSGYIVIQLSEPIHPTQFSLEHISSSMSPSGKIDSAPRDFIVYGLQGEKDENPVELGEYTYLDNSTPLQFFPVQHPSDLSFPYIELDIKTNYGNINYTCLYRFRVHGNR